MLGLRWNLNGSYGRDKVCTRKNVWGQENLSSVLGLSFGWSFQSLRSLSLTCLPVPGCTVLMVKYHSQVLQCCGQGLSRRLLGIKSNSSLTNWVASCASLTFQTSLLGYPMRKLGYAASRHSPASTQKNKGNCVEIKLRALEPSCLDLQSLYLIPHL